MAHVHETHGHGSTTVVERDGEGPTAALIVLIVVAALALLIWFFAFSGIVINRDSGGGGTTNNFNNEQVDPGNNSNTGPGYTVPEPGGTGG
jgi:hypothetical protein